MKKNIFYKADKDRVAELLADRSIPPGAKVIILNLIYRLGGKTYSYPSKSKIGKDVGLGSRQVANHLNILKEKGYITWTRGGVNERTGKSFGSNKYFLTNLIIKKEITKNETK